VYPTSRQHTGMQDKHEQVWLKFSLKTDRYSNRKRPEQKVSHITTFSSSMGGSYQNRCKNRIQLAQRRRDNVNKFKASVTTRNLLKQWVLLNCQRQLNTRHF